ncbi:MULTISPECIES: hypothetical protein [Pseudomonas]|uniref:Uncharacterized protein n=1 Tax=Pseudomonas sp. W17 TaxID=3144407 RepID=A0AAU7WMF1_9PSED|nr:hypothetical protein [Pseudomonas protegens]MCD9570220.1 hypothetical protein [Pseudomonas protegens]WRV89191.1 hypothetical protein VP719_19795 [Pseudomonas protegens]BAO63029.1 hypothetical protein PPC_3682 [Pseudomonas protegens Cab57]
MTTSTHQRFQIRACRKFALEQNQRLFRQAQALDSQAYGLLDQEHLEIDTFERYRLLRNKAQAKYQEAVEHLRLINREFVDPQSPQDHSTFADTAQPLLRLSGR